MLQRTCIRTKAQQERYSGFIPISIYVHIKGSYLNTDGYI